MTTKACGWIPPRNRTKEQTEIDEQIKQSFLRPFGSVGPKAKPINPGDEYCLYRVFGGKTPYAWQAIGSCVGAGGYNALRTLQKAEIVLGHEAETDDQLFWPLTWMVSRILGGMHSKGDGSLGSTWFKAMKDFGMPAASEIGLPQYEDRQGWVWLGEKTETAWSYDTKLEKQYADAAAKHKIGGGSQVTSIEELDAALTNGYPCTIASEYGTKTIRELDGLQVAKWDDDWPHQMFFDAVKNIKGRKYYRDGNNWGPDAHPAPSDDSPPGGFWIPEADVARNLSDRYTECFALSLFEGFPAAQDDYWALLQAWWDMMINS